jgi:hypothetical protein
MKVRVFDTPGFFDTDGKDENTIMALYNLL